VTRSTAASHGLAPPPLPDCGAPRGLRPYICHYVRGRIAIATALLCLIAAPAANANDARWVRKALRLQYELASDVELRNAPWVYTHNSYNSDAEMGATLSNRDPNQSIAILDQLDEGVRSLEIDTHLFTSPQDPRVGPRGPVVCHARGEDEGHAGCTTEKPLVTVLRDVRGWLDRHPDQVLLLYLESHLESPEGYAAGADSVEETLGGLVHRPAGRGARCEALPLDLTRDALRAARKQVVIMGPCGEGNRWQGYVFDEKPRKTGSDNSAFRDYPDCGPDFTRAQYDGQVIRYYEDGTQLSRSVNGATDPIDGALTARMTRCGVDLIGFDFLARGDPRLAALVWSWAPGQPTARGSCSVQRSDSRWETRACTERHRVACRDAAGQWFVPRGRVIARAAPRLCASARVANGVPRTGFDGQQLRAAMVRGPAATTWLGLRLRTSGWTRIEKKGCGPSITRPRKRRRVSDGVARFVVRLRFACTGERLRGRRPFVVVGGLRRVRSRAGRSTRVAVAASTRKLKIRFRYTRKARSVTVLLRR